MQGAIIEMALMSGRQFSEERRSFRQPGRAFFGYFLYTSKESNSLKTNCL